MGNPMQWLVMILLTLVGVHMNFFSSAHAQCPALGRDTTCGAVVTVTKNGATVATTGQGPYDGSDDTLVGVNNNSGKLVRALGLSSTLPIFGFDGDGITTFGAPGNPNPASFGYGGPNAYFTNVSTDRKSGLVNFITPISAGGTAYFSLENALGSAVSCSAVLNGSVPKPGGGSPTISTMFTPNMGLSLTQAAQDCGFTGFNWMQKVTQLPDPNPFTANNGGAPVKLTGASVPFNDPPPGGGLTGSNDFSYPFYCSGTDFNAGQLCARTNTSLQYSDTPKDVCIPNPDGTPSPAFLNDPALAAACGNKTSGPSSFIAFSTDLVGILSSFVVGTDCISLKTCVDLGIGFSWTDDFNGNAGNALVLKNGVPADLTSGIGGVAILDYSANTDYQFGLPITITNVVVDVPEPQSIPIMILGVLTLWIVGRKKPHVQ